MGRAGCQSDRIAPSCQHSAISLGTGRLEGRLLTGQMGSLQTDRASGAPAPPGEENGGVEEVAPGGPRCSGGSPPRSSGSSRLPESPTFSRTCSAVRPRRSVRRCTRAICSTAPRPCSSSGSSRRRSAPEAASWRGCPAHSRRKRHEGRHARVRVRVPRLRDDLNSLHRGRRRLPDARLHQPARPDSRLPVPRGIHRARRAPDRQVARAKGI